MKEVLDFMVVIKDDPRIGPLHISLYSALAYFRVVQGGEGPVSFKAKELMAAARIAGGTPFHRCIKQLHVYGYIRYEPSFNSAVKSKVWLEGH